MSERTHWRWQCIRCPASGPADSAEHASALGRTHDAYACPDAPGLRHPVQTNPLIVLPDELASRRAWSTILRERYRRDEPPEQ